MTFGSWVKRLLGVALAVAVSLGLWWLRPIPAAPQALAVLDGTALPPPIPSPAPSDSPPATPEASEAPEPVPVTIGQNRNAITIQASDSRPERGVVFRQGALVDPRAYVRILSPIAEAGYLVVIMKAPFDLPITDIGGVSSVLKQHPEVTWWAVGGHSLGGVAASAFASSSPRLTPALFLWASYPSSNLAEVDELDVLSVSATRDGLTTPEDVEASKAKLPEDTTYVAVPGAVHSSFGDYGTQPGDGVPATPHDQAQAQIVAATLQWLNTVSAVA